MSTAGWASCLDSFADHLAYQRQALAEGAPERIEAFVPSGVVGPIPMALVPRAQELHAQAQALTEHIQQARAHTLASLQQLRQPSEAPRPSYVDSMA